MTGINLTGKGWIPYCEECEYIGKPREEKCKAAAAVRHHVCNPAHRLTMLRKDA